MLSQILFDLQDLAYKCNSGQTALSGINLQIVAGQRLVLLGPNGCGKSTLQKILSGLIFLSFGRLIAFGCDITFAAMQESAFAAKYRRKIGLIFQNSDVQLFCASVLDEIMFGLLNLGLDWQSAKNKVEELMEYAGITGLADRMPHHLSGGEKKKVTIAAMLAINPEVVIMDEPTNGLDPRTQCWLLDTINQLNSRGKSLIIATHQLDLAAELASRIVVLDENHKILVDATPKVILINRQLLAAANLI